MTYREHFKEEILDIACRGEQLAVKKDGTPHSCSHLDCAECIGDMVSSCSDAVYAWCNSEYVEPCPFKPDELVEVSEDGVNWSLRYFSSIKDDDVMVTFRAYSLDSTGKKLFTLPWKYCKKYGTLGGIAKGAE